MLLLWLFCGSDMFLMLTPELQKLLSFADCDDMSGRARGRARGRSRAAAADQAPARRPGEPVQAPDPAPVGTAAPPGAAPTQTASGAATPESRPTGPIPSGRASYRGGTREPRPGMSGDKVRAPVEGMSGLRVGAGSTDVERRDYGFYNPRTRPDSITDSRGKSGQPVKLTTNYFKLEKAVDWHLYHYHVDFLPEVDSPFLRKVLLLVHKEILGYINVFDGQSLYLVHRLPNNVTEVYSKRNIDGADIRIKIALVVELQPDSPEITQMYNIILRRVMSLIKMKQIGRNYYNPEKTIEIPQHRLQVMPGFFTAIATHEKEVLMCVDISHKILRTGTVLDTIMDLHRRFGDKLHDHCIKALVGQIVMTRYNNKTYRITDIDWDTTPENTFSTKKGDRSYVEYYLTQHTTQIKDLQQPMLVSRTKEKDRRAGLPENLYLVPELCVLTGLTDEARADYRVMHDVGQHTRVPPDNRCQTLSSFINNITSDSKVAEFLQNWDIQFSRKLLTLDARILPPEKIHCRNADVPYSQAEAEWSKNMKSMMLISTVHINNWMILFTRRDCQNAQELTKALQFVGKPMDIRVADPIACELKDDRNDTFLATIRNNMSSNTQMVVVIVPTNRKDRYDAIKKLTCVDHPVPSQVVISKTLSKKQGLKSVATKIMIQLNCKLGGEPWVVDIPLKKLMVVGFDTYHDSSSKGRSVGGVIASLNPALTRYYSHCTFQHNHEELMNGLKVSMRSALGKYREVNGYLPERIIVYRDGVGDGQLKAVHDHELPQVMRCFKDLGTDYDPMLTYIVVKKRINTRFFATAGQRMENPIPGTIIDTDVTKPIWYDFFLISQSVRQGTVSPTHYNVIWDKSNLIPDHIQRLTYKLTHLYYNWPGTIRVPAPCQYAHKLAFLVGQSLHKDPSPALSDRLYFL